MNNSYRGLMTVGWLYLKQRSKDWPFVPTPTGFALGSLASKCEWVELMEGVKCWKEQNAPLAKRVHSHDYFDSVAHN